MIKIRSRYDGKVLFESATATTFKEAVKEAGADLSWANLSGVNLSWADLSGVNLSWADLTRADLCGCVLQPLPSPWVWQQTNGLGTRIVDGRVLALGKRSQKTQHCGDTVYESGKLYVAPYFSRCTMTECHPGLYVAGTDYNTGPDVVLVAYWLDELLVAGTMDHHKARVPRFYVCADPAAFEAVTAADLEPEKEE